MGKRLLSRSSSVHFFRILSRSLLVQFSLRKQPIIGPSSLRQKHFVISPT